MTSRFRLFAQSLHLLRALTLHARQLNRLRLDKQVLEAHEAATKALKSCRETNGLTVERVETTLDALAEVSHRDAVKCSGNNV